MSTMLAVDDEPDILQALAAYLEATVPGLTVVTAASGAEALLELDKREPDLVLSDYKMPGMSGIDLLAQVGKRFPRVPCLLMTAYADSELAMRAVHETRVQQFLTKPVDPQRLSAIVREILAAREGAHPEHAGPGAKNEGPQRGTRPEPAKAKPESVAKGNRP